MPDLPHLSTLCPKCGDKVSMPAVGGAASLGRHRIGTQIHEVYIVLYKCTNRDGMGATIGYFTINQTDWKLLNHVPKYTHYQVSENVPERSRLLLQEANDAKKTPAACVMTASRAIEAMLAEQGFKNRKHSLKKRIDQAVQEYVLPKVMGDWAHEVREFAREGHTDEEPQELPDKDDAEHVLTYANTLAEYLYVLPSRHKKVLDEPEAEGRPEEPKPAAQTKWHRSTG